MNDPSKTSGIALDKVFRLVSKKRNYGCGLLLTGRGLRLLTSKSEAREVRPVSEALGKSKNKLSNMHHGQLENL